MKKEAIIELMKREVVPAIGCTEPAAVSFAVAKARETLGDMPDKIDIRLSANVLKNAMGVGIPGTGMIGLPIAVALGALIGRSEYGLEVLRDLTPEALAEGRQMIDEKRITITLASDAPDRLFIEALCFRGESWARVVVAGEHTRVCRVEKNGEIRFLDVPEACLGEDSSPLIPNLTAVYRFAMDTPPDEIRFILESARLNRAAARLAFESEYGHALGRTLGGDSGRRLLGESLLPRILACTSAACDARMAGAMIPVMTNSGSGNQGITATLPVAVYAEARGCSESDLIRALTLSHLVVIYLKQRLGRLSAQCGCVAASTGSACGITYLMGGGYVEVSYAVQNMIANLSGMICDGAKPSCSLKVSSGVTTALFSAMLALEGRSVSPVEGIIDADVDRSICNLARLASEGMCVTDKMILEIMTHK
jgi:L-cysteine desulfidase